MWKGAGCPLQGRMRTNAWVEGSRMKLNVSKTSFPPLTYLLFNNKIILDSVILWKQPTLHHQKLSLPQRLFEQVSGGWKPLLKGLKVCWCVVFQKRGSITTLTFLWDSVTPQINENWLGLNDYLSFLTLRDSYTLNIFIISSLPSIKI